MTSSTSSTPARRQGPGVVWWLMGRRFPSIVWGPFPDVAAGLSFYLGRPPLPGDAARLAAAGWVVGPSAWAGPMEPAREHDFDEIKARTAAAAGELLRRHADRDRPPMGRP